MNKLERLRKRAYRYYSRRDVQAAIAEQARNKETIPFYFDPVYSDTLGNFGKRPDIIEYPQDVANLAAKGATSFHVSEELWSNPLELSTDLRLEQLNKLRKGWDLILDIDCKFIEYSKIAAWLLCEALYFHGVRNFGLKFSGGSGFHIGLKFRAFPSKVYDIDIKNFFPEGPRVIASYLKEMISQDLAKRLLELSSLKDISKATGKPIEALIDEEKKFNPFSILEIDTVLISSRHLYRMAYSLHEKKGLASIVMRPEQIKAFHPAWAKPERVFVKPFMPEPKQEEAKELLVQALDWKARKEASKEREKIEKKKRTPLPKIKIEKLNEEMFPPCIKNILLGMKHDGRKRALFILINFFRSLDLSIEDIELKIKKWNKLNYRSLKENYIATQLQWFKKQEPRLPPNCNLNAYYLDLGVCPADSPSSICKKIKNPVNYVLRRARIAERQSKEEKGKRKKWKGRSKRKSFKYTRF
ncbi:MAG: hypothetical protein IB618_02300 [Candidatus Pacearchaeota archaeon]|nr:MAG: hypothetical protein IB618_02300 [Candidatus Pacearchaeota archaeon]